SELATLEEGRVPAVILLDVVGPLAHCYALGVIAFVGGSLVPVGGHNVIEPARAGRPVLVGPHTEHAADTVERLVAGGAALRVGCAAPWCPRRSPTARSRPCATVSTAPAGSAPPACPRTW